MNSYPPELLAQLAPVMFVAGLNPPAQTPGQNPNANTPVSSPAPGTPTAATTPATPQARIQDPFTLLMLRLREALLSQRKVAIWQPEKAKLFQIVMVDKEVQFPPRKILPTEDINNYTHHGNTTPFPGVYSSSNNAPHSPLSPLTPSSPLYPDGLIAPIWIRKHTTLVPSVFVIFLRIYEYPPHNPKSPLDPPDLEREREREQEERKRDTELASEIALRKKTTNERNIKLTVVLMASRRMLDDPALDTRLTFIRRQSGLDSRAALFVLSPVTLAELSEFVQSLQQALYEPALDYYTTHSKRVRRKRNRHSQSTAYAVPATPLASANTARPLRPEGWTVRYEYKMACFAEFRGEDEVALKHYQDAYAMLLMMFGSTAILPPRTKRWAEAKVLADCINIKIVKLYLYNNEHSLSLAQHNSHMRKFSDFSRGWGIGDETFEYWSWLARQHRVLAELLEQGTRSSLKLPVHNPIPPSAVAQSLLTSPQIQVPSQRTTNPLELDAVKQLGMNPYHALQHPGFYYFMAAKCTENRRSRFKTALDAEIARGGASIAPGFVNEKKVDHLVIILELYTKAYELFKKYTPVNPSNPAQGRLTLWIAYRIAQTYYDSGKFDMAVKFYERIAKTYRREKWDHMLRPLLQTWHKCAQRLGDVDLSIRLLVELLGHDVVDSEDASTLEEDLLTVLESTMPLSPDKPLIVDLAESKPVFKTTVNFWSSHIKVNEPVAFQIILEAPKHVTISQLPFQTLAIYFEDDAPPLVIKHRWSEEDTMDGRASQRPKIHRVELGRVLEKYTASAPPQGIDEQENAAIEATLCWQPGDMMLISGNMIACSPGMFKVVKVVLTIVEGTWNVTIPCDPRAYRQEHIPRWMSSTNPLKFIPLKETHSSAAVIRHRSHQIRVSVSHQAPAYLNEEFPITLDIKNEDELELEVMLDVLLQPTELDEAINSITLDDEQSSSLIRGIDCGRLAPGANIVKSLYLLNTGAGGDRVIDISVRSRPVIVRPPTPPPPTDDAVVVGVNEPTPEHVGQDQSQENEKMPRVAHQEHEHKQDLDMTETLRTLVIPTVDPIKFSREVVYRHSTKKWANIGDLQTFDGDFWDDRIGGEAIINVKVEFEGPWEVEVISIGLIKEDNDCAKVIGSSLDRLDDKDGQEDPLPVVFMPSDTFSEHCVVSLAPLEEIDITVPPEPIQGPGHYIITWRRIRLDKERGPTSITRVFLPTLNPPPEGLVALLKVPPLGRLHTPLPLELIIRNYHSTRSANIIIYLEPDSSDVPTSVTANTLGAPSVPSTPISGPATPTSTTYSGAGPGGPTTKYHGSNSFLVAGLRSGRIPILLPLTEQVLRWDLVPMECGYCQLPIIKVLDARRAAAMQNMQGEGDANKGVPPPGAAGGAGAPGAGSNASTAGGALASLGEQIKIVDLRTGVRKVERDEDLVADTPKLGRSKDDEPARPGTILILPPTSTL